MLKTKVSTVSKQLTLFGRAVIASDRMLPFAEVNKIAVKAGYIVHPEMCTDRVLDWLRWQKYNPNSTFYKTWNDIITKNRFELAIDQLIHYASTYGTDFKGEPYIPNKDVVEVDFTDMKVVAPIDAKELADKCCKMFYSGIALKEETIADLLLILDDIDMMYMLDIEQVKNREAKMNLYDMSDTLPKSPEEMVRFLLYKTINKTMVIKDRATIQALKLSGKNISYLIEKFGLEKLSSVFYRYKPIFLAMRTNMANRPVINRLRKFAVKNHIPYKPGFFELILSKPSLVPKLEAMLPNLNNFKKVLLLQTIKVRQTSPDLRPFLVRNQKLYIKQEQVTTKEYYKIIYDMIYKSLVDSLKQKACKVKLSEVLDLTLPTSEKSFIGNYPLGTSVKLNDKDAIVGINWRGSEGANDLDLSYTDISGKKVGWNAAYYTSKKDVVYSGDMTSARPEATELMYASKGFDPGILKVNLYSGANNSKFRMFIATEKIRNATRGNFRNHMVDPNNIVFQAEMETTSKETTLGVILPEKFVIANFRTGSGRVAGDSVTNKYTDYVLATIDCYLSVKDVLTDAGFTFTNQDFDVDLSNPDKSTLINLLG